jgi:hypothetical protein
VAYVSVTMKYDETLFPSGPIELGFEHDGALLYDGREDTTNGGSGAQRFDDPDTWKYRQDPATAAYHYRRGFMTENGQRLCGMTDSAEDLLAQSYQASATVCDGLVGGEPRYAVSVFLSDDRTHGENLESLLHAMAGYEVNRWGIMVCIPGASQAAVGTVGKNDLWGRRQAL